MPISFRCRKPEAKFSRVATAQYIMYGKLVSLIIEPFFLVTHVIQKVITPEGTKDPPSSYEYCNAGIMVFMGVVSFID
jgi:hypothetical protein